MSSGFVSEADLAERRRVRVELWQKEKGEDDPDEPPEEPTLIHDHRTLFDRLQEQKDKKQDEWDETHKLKNMVRGLEDDEVDFLDFVDSTKIREEKRIRNEEKKAIEDFRKKVSNLQKQNVLSPEVKESAKKSPSSNAKQSQMSLLAGAIKRKSSGSQESENKRIKSDVSHCDNENKKAAAEKESVVTNGVESNNVGTTDNTADVGKYVAVLPGLGVYSDSSDTEREDGSNSSDSECPHDNAPRDLTGRILKLRERGDGCC